MDEGDLGARKAREGWCCWVRIGKSNMSSKRSLFLLPLRLSPYISTLQHLTTQPHILLHRLIIASSIYTSLSPFNNLSPTNSTTKIASHHHARTDHPTFRTTYCN